MVMFKTRGPGHGGEVTIKCRTAGCENELTIGVIELSRLHHPPVCAECKKRAEDEVKKLYRAERIGYYLALIFALALIAIGLSGCASTHSEIAPTDGPNEPAIPWQIAPDPVLHIGQGVQERSVFFPTDVAAVQDESNRALSMNARFLHNHPSVHVRIEGNADERGSERHNDALSYARAHNVELRLLAKGVAPDQMSIVGWGYFNNRCWSHDEECWASNRRVDIVYVQ